MTLSKRMTGKLLEAVVIAAMLATGSVNAAENRDAAPGYAEDSSSNVVKTGSGDCLHTGSWTEADAVSGWL